MYFIDELNGGNVYKFTSAANFGEGQEREGRLLCCRPDLRPASRQRQHAERHRRVHWVPFTDAQRRRSARGTDHHGPRGVTSVDARNTTNLAAVQGHGLPAPRGHADPDGERRGVPLHDDDHHERGLPARSEEQHDLRLREPEHHQPGHRPCRWGLRSPTPTTSRSTMTGTSTSSRTSNGGGDDDIWFAKDLNRDGDLTDPGEGMARWASNGTVGLGVHRPVFRPDRQAPGLGQHPASATAATTGRSKSRSRRAP